MPPVSIVSQASDSDNQDLENRDDVSLTESDVESRVFNSLAEYLVPSRVFNTTPEAAGTEGDVSNNWAVTTCIKTLQ